MNESNKLIADARRIMKYERAQNGGRYNGQAVCEKIAALFERNNPMVSSLAKCVSAYWIREYVEISSTPENEPSDENLDRLCAMQNFLEGEDYDNEILSEKDWRELGDLVRYEAEDMPLDLLSSMMSIIVDKKAI